ncbi:MAG: hypothetical protein ACON49_06865 [Candidatus Puniceispirillaceae bacterium]
MVKLFVFFIATLFASQASALASKSDQPNHNIIAATSIEREQLGRELLPLQDVNQLHVAKIPFELKNPDAFFNYRQEMLSGGFYGLQNWDRCLSVYRNKIKWPKNQDADVGEAFEFKMFLLNCVQVFLAAGDHSKDKLDDFTQLLLHWVDKNDDALRLPKFNIPDNQWYTVSSFMGNLAQWFVFYKDKLNLSFEEKQRVTDYLQDYLLSISFNHALRNGRIRCPDNAKRIVNKKVGTDWCGSVRWKVATGRLAFGFMLESEALISKGINDLQILLNAYDEEAYFVPYAPQRKGGYGFSYYMRQGIFLSVLAELIAMRGYDFLVLELPNGATVQQALDFTYEVAVHDFTLLGKYPGKGKFTRNPKWQWNKISTLKHSEFASKIASTNGRYDPINTAEQFAARNPRYSFRNKPDVFAGSHTYRDNLVDDFSSISALSLFLANSDLSRRQWSEKAVERLADPATQEEIKRRIKSLKPMGVDLDETFNSDNQLSSYKSGNIDGFAQFSADTGWTITDMGKLEITDLEKYETVAGQSDNKFKVRFTVKAYLPVSRRLYKGKVTLFVNGSQIHIGHWAENLVQKGYVTNEEMSSLKQSCDYDNADDIYYLIIPLYSDNEMSNSRIPCYFANANSEEYREILKFMLIAGRLIAEEEELVAR